jgi:hypothetical protein
MVGRFPLGGGTGGQSGKGFLGPDMLQLDAAYALMQFPGTVLTSAQSQSPARTTPPNLISG